MNLQDLSQTARDGLIAEAYARAKDRQLAFKTRGMLPDDFARTYLRIQNKQQQLIPLVYNRVQRDYLANRTRRDLVLKSRQQGLSTVIQAELFRVAVTRSAVTMTLAHDDETTQKLRRMADRFYDNMPEKPRRKYANSTLTSYPGTKSESNIATAGGKNKGRGGTYSDFHGSEVAFWVDAEAIVAGAMQGGDPSVTLESTPNGAQGYFFERCQESLDGSSNWKLHFYPWWYDADYRIALDPGETIAFDDKESALVTRHGLTTEQIKWRRSKQNELKYLFPQEYPEDPMTCFLQSGIGYFGDISNAWIAPLNPNYNPDHSYYAGLDFGQTNDYTALNIIDGTANVEVATMRINRLLWKDMRTRAINLCKMWNIKKIVAEANSMGTTNTEEMRREMREAGLRARLVEFDTTNDSKATIMSGLYETLHAADGLKLQADPIQQQEMNAFIAEQLPGGSWRLAAAGSQHDDTVIARALAYYASRNIQNAKGETW